MSPSILNICREISTSEEFASLREDWNVLLAQCSYPSAFCTWDWAFEWWQHFGAGSGCRLVVALAFHPDGTLIGLAPFFFPDAKAGALRLRPLRPLATRMRCTVDDMTEQPIVLLHRDWTEKAWQGLWAALTAWEGREHWDLIHLRVMRPASAQSLRTLWRQFPRTWPFLFTRSSQRLGQTRSLPATWAEFKQSLGKSMRDNIAYYPRLLNREGHAWSVRIARTPEEVAEAAPALIRLHGLRVNSDRGPVHLDHLPGPVQKDFLCAVLARLADAGQAAVAVLEVDGQPVAAQAVLETAGRLAFYYSGFDPQWHRYSPVTVLHIAVIQDAIARGLSGLDYLPEAEPWKTRWGTEAEFVFDEISCLSVYPRAVFRSAWRRVNYGMSRRHGLPCECGFCFPLEQKNEIKARQTAPANNPVRRSP